MLDSRFIIGIDLGTTNTAVSYIDTETDDTRICPFPITQIVTFGEYDEKPLFPAFCYLPTPAESNDGLLDLPWSASREYVLGQFARDHGAASADRLVSSAKSWLAHAGVDRTQAILPWSGDSGSATVSPVTVSAMYLTHIRHAWNHKFGRLKDSSGSRCVIENQQVILTIPASFDETARELTIDAAKQAGFENLVLVEEPLAAFYAWLHKQEGQWQEIIKPGEQILIADIGGGTTDLSLVQMDSSNVLHRYAVGDHLLLGGDNIDIAIARHVEKEWRIELNSCDWSELCQTCRRAKESLLSEDRESVNITLMARGSSVIKNAKSAVLGKTHLMEIIESGFFPKLRPDEAVETRRSGIRQMGLPYASNPAITHHILSFLRSADRIARELEFRKTSGPESLSDLRDSRVDSESERALSYPDKILFNGGTMIPPQIRSRIISTIASWFPNNSPPTELKVTDYSLAVTLGAAYYGKVRRGLGIKVKGGIARSYYIEVEDSQHKKQLICVIARDTDENVEVAVPGKFFLQTNMRALFNLYSSATRLTDRPGDTISDREELSAVAPLLTVVRFGKSEKRSIDVTVVTRLTEVGSLELSILSTQTDHKWPLKFDLRSIRDAADSANSQGPEIILDAAKVTGAQQIIESRFNGHGRDLPALFGLLEKELDIPRRDWSIQLLRELADTMISLKQTRGNSAEHETRWLNLAGFCLRPGFGDPADQLRVREIWKIWFDDVRYSKNPQATAEWWVFWRRIAAGLKGGHQITIANRLRKLLFPKGVYRRKIREGAQTKTEMWRCLGSLEAVSIQLKISIATVLLERVDVLEPFEYWVLARVGARRLFHGPLASVVPPLVARNWLKKIAAASPSRAARDMQLFSAAQLATVTGDRNIDLPSETVAATLEFLQTRQCNPRWINPTGPESLNSSELLEQLLSDKLPLGLSIDR